MSRAAIFLDRDGTLNVDDGYVSRCEQFQFIDGAIEACYQLQQMGYRLVLITNQSGIARGKFSQTQFDTLTDWMRQQLAFHQVELSAVYYCPHHPDLGQGDYRQTCHCRKPQPGMLLAAKQQLKLDMTRSYMVGDRLTDMQAAAAAGVGTRVLVCSGQPPTPHVIAQADWVLDNLAELPAAIAARARCSLNVTLLDSPGLPGYNAPFA